MDRLCSHSRDPLLWILPPVAELIFLYVVRTMKRAWGQDCGYSEDIGGSALLNPKAL